MLKTLKKKKFSKKASKYLKLLDGVAVSFIDRQEAEIPDGFKELENNVNIKKL